MYLYHFGFSELPFTLTPNTSFYCELQGHQEALEVLLTALKTGEGFIKITGEVGTGKTLLCRKLLNDIPEYFVTVYIPNPYLSPAELRQAIAAELGIEPYPNNDSQNSNDLSDTEFRLQQLDQHQLSYAIEQKLLAINQQNKTVVILLDEAQALPQESLEALRLISNLETEVRKLVQIVLVGQPELDERLSRREFRQLRQRITFSYQLQTLSENELGRYIHHRLQLVGYKGAPLFYGNLLQAVHKASRGVPRLANVLVHKSLLSAYGAGRHYVEVSDVLSAIQDTEDANRLPAFARLFFKNWIWFAIGILAALCVSLFIFIIVR